ncbi:MAG TPA: hypothetical protein VMW49_03770, partial [Candidatus Dormibacteraeota bacterium]|nr:hypothetical protein [Candidatus Dormibacteraeota bacterium]
MTPPRFVYDRGAAQCVWNDPLAEFAFDRVLTDRRSGEVTAELAVWLTSPTRALQHRGRVNLMSTRSRAEFANLLEKRAKGLDWAGMLEVASFRVVDASRKGRAPLILSTAQRPAMGANLFGPELPIPADDPVVFHGDGGDMKSFTALAIAASVASG